MNPALILLWVIVAVLLVLSIGSLIAYSLYLYTNSGPDIVNPTPQCSDLISQLPNITDQGCCEGQGNIKYNAQLLLDMAPEPTNYQTVCRQFCSGYYNENTDTCTGDTQYNTRLVSNCVNAMKPVNCIGPALPLALSGSTVYYGNKANLNGCNTVPCI